MFRKAFAFGGLLLLGGAAVLVTPGSGQAQHRGGGSFHGGGFHGGGFHGGGFRGGGFHAGRFHAGFGGYGYGAYYPYYGYYDSYEPSSNLSPGVTDDSGYYGSYGDVTPSYSDYYAPATAAPDTSAGITVKVPADAEIWFNDTKTTSTGSVRAFHSPPLTPGDRYTYDIRARWNENGHELTQTQQVKVTAGAKVNVQFLVQPTKAPTAPSH
jgi:uncharacterized protein (TIGR03000 family)